MLGKLIKYEWKSVWNTLIIINAFTIAMTLLGLISLSTPALGNMGDDGFVLAMLLFMLYYITIIGVSLAICIYIAIRFHHNLYTDEGYLMHTLPVTSRQLIISKLIVHSVCIVITGILVLLSVMLLIVPLVNIVSDDPAALLHTFHTIAEGCREIFGMSLPVLIPYLCFVMIVGSISSVLMIYAAISIGQTFQKHKVMASIFCYIGLYMIMQTVVSFAVFPQTLSMTSGNFDMGSYMRFTFYLSTLSSIVTGIGFYIITEVLMKKKLNLD